MNRDNERPVEDTPQRPSRSLQPPRQPRATRKEIETEQRLRFIRRSQQQSRRSQDPRSEIETDPRYMHPSRASRPARDPRQEIETDPRYMRPDQASRPNRDPRPEIETNSRYRRTQSRSSRQEGGTGGDYSYQPGMRRRSTQERIPEDYAGYASLPVPPPRPIEGPPVVRRTKRLPPPKRRSAWPWLLMGCAGGILLVAIVAAIAIVTTLHALPGSGIGSILPQNTYTKTDHQTVAMPNFTQMQVHNQIGNITIALDSSGNTSAVTMTTVKKVKASSQDAANNEFGRILVQAGPAETSATTLVVQATLPTQGSSLNTNDSVDLTITVPFSAMNTTAPLSFNIATLTGDISVDGLSGFQSINDKTGNVTLRHARLTAGSCVQTGHGNVIFEGTLDTSSGVPFDPCDSTQKPDPNPHPWYKIHSEVGNVDVTLPPPTLTTNLLLNASTINGKMTSDFDPAVQQNTDGSADSNGPLLANATPPPTAQLLIDVSIGDIHLHKAAATS
jgi:hypothetical protein